MPHARLLDCPARPDMYVSLDAAAAMLGVRRTWCHIARGELFTIAEAGRVLVLRDDLRRLRAATSTPPA